MSSLLMENDFYRKLIVTIEGICHIILATAGETQGSIPLQKVPSQELHSVTQNGLHDC